MALMSGFARIGNNAITVLVNDAEKSSDINPQEAQQTLEIAEANLKKAEGYKKRIKLRDTRISANFDNWDNAEGWDAQEDPRWDDCGWHVGDDDDHESQNEKENDKESDNNPGGFHKYRHLWVQCDVCYGLNYKPLFNSQMFLTYQKIKTGILE
ncbi:hypothetical protein RHMOL_RhmolPtG0001200 (chloroplast) [Rhododendron molle]|uniref:Uncharacterized protein n=1 Tax=Rhododendron molle TaxID=49168 RepID=A0ACC0L1H5_RHOML|nr:hypothetical protein RHMOL_RhmolPtG0001200 [Rhododendron molle]